ncbi:hypothetical protein DSO57_1001387 [Entomophthora muscae]|nr:hypothetical protein DSO57_1001387 [Entomophthora muscae]
MECLIKLSTQNSRNRSIIDNVCCENTLYPDGFYVAESYPDFLELLDTPMLVDHCTVRRYPSAQDEECSLADFKTVPSLEITIYHFPSYQFVKEEFQATKLSLEMIYGWTINCFRWANECFPNLQHFYVENVVPDELIFLKSNCFPKLVHFYTSVTQSNFFWSELIKAAPNLMYIHTDSMQSNIVENLRPLLQVVPYRNIMGFSGGTDEISGYNGCLYDR